VATSPSADDSLHLKLVLDDHLRKTKNATTFSECQKELRRALELAILLATLFALAALLLVVTAALELALLHGHVVGFGRHVSPDDAVELAILHLHVLVGRGRHVSPGEFSVSGRHKSHGEGNGEEDGGGGSLHYFLRSIGFYDSLLAKLSQKGFPFSGGRRERKRKERGSLVTLLQVDSTKPELCKR
jgi:hypothetical protein